MTIKMIHAMWKTNFPTSHFPPFSTSTPNKCWSTGKPCHIWQTEDDLEEPTPLRLDVHHHLLHRFLHLRLRLLGHHQPRQWLRLLKNKIGRHFSIFFFLCIWLEHCKHVCHCWKCIFSKERFSDKCGKLLPLRPNTVLLRFLKEERGGNPIPMMMILKIRRKIQMRIRMVVLSLQRRGRKIQF